MCTIREVISFNYFPSLPADWKKGEFSGLKARGGFEVAVKWENGQIVDASVKSLQGNKFRIWYNGNYLQANGLKKGKSGNGINSY